jgi:thiol-disulfide isomerase/thioredoxin
MFLRFLPALLLCCFALSSSRAAERPILPTGSPLPDFQLPGVDGRDYTPADFSSAEVLVIVFTSNHCPTAQLYEERLKQLVTDYRERPVAFVAVNPNHNPAVHPGEMGYTDLDDSLESMKERARHRGFNFPYVDDGPTQAFSEKLGAVATPHVFIFDRERRLRFNGRIDDSERPDLVKRSDAREAIDALLAGRQPPVAQTKVFGCSVKWRESAETNRRWREKLAQEPVDLAPADATALRELRANRDSGKVRLINVWATWCGPCVAEFDELVDQHHRFSGRDFELVTVAAHFPDEEKKVRQFLRKHNAVTRNLLFGSTDKYALLEALDPDWNGALPHTLLVAPNGDVIYRQTGAIDFLALRRALLPALDAIAPWTASGN